MSSGHYCDGCAQAYYKCVCNKPQEKVKEQTIKMTRKFSEVLEDYLHERDLLNGDYYDNRFLNARTLGQHRMEDLAQELDKMVKGVEE